MNEVLCVYHANCADGFSAAWVVKQAMRKMNIDVEFHPGNYGDDLSNVEGRDIYLVDFSYKRDKLLEIAKLANRIVIIDHHKSSIEDLVDLPNNVEFIHATDKCGAILTWEHFFGDATPPEILYHVQDRDLWQFKMKNTRAVMAYIFSYEYDFENWGRFMEMNLKSAIKDGKAILRKQKKDHEEFLGAAQFRIMLQDIDVPVANVPYMWASEVGHILAKNEAFSVTYFDTKEYRKFSLRSHDDGMDVAKIAEIYGGGGHLHSAGFTIPHDKLKEYSLGPFIIVD